MNIPTWLKIVIAILLFIAIVLAIALPLAAQSTLESSQVGISYNAASKKINEEELYTEGRHTIGVAAKFIVFQVDVQNLDFNAVQTRSKDGLIITIDISFQFKLNESSDAYEFVNLNYNFPDNSYQDAFIKISRNVIRDIASKYTAYDFTKYREDIRGDLENELGERLSKYNAQVQNVQLLDISFPSEFQQTITDAQNALLDQETAKNEKTKVEEQNKNLIDQANNQVESKRIEYTTKQTQKEQQYLATSTQILNNIEAKLEGYKKLASTFSLSDPESIIKYQWQNSIQNLAEKQLKFPFQFTTPASVQALYTTP